MDSSTGIGVGAFQYTPEQRTGEINEFNPFQKPTYFKRDFKPDKVIVRPTSTSAGKHGQPYEFKLEADPYRWTNLQNIRIVGQMRVVKVNLADGKTSKPGADEDFGLVNNFKQSIWSKIIVKINGCEIADPTSDPYAYKALVECLINYTTEYKENVLFLQNGYAEEEAGEGLRGNSCKTLKKNEAGDGDVENDDYNSALDKRRKIIADGEWEEINILMHSDIITCDKPLPPGYTLEFKMTRMNDSFVFLQPTANDNNYKIELQDIHLVIERIQKPDNVLQAYNLKKNSSFAFLSLARNYLKTYPAIQGQTDLCQYNLISGQQLPEFMLVFIVSQDAYNGKTSRNPFYFHTHYVEQCSLLTNSVLEPNIPYTNLSDKFQRQTLYNDFLSNIGASQRDSLCCSVTYNKFYGGYHMFAFDRTETNRAHNYIMDGGQMGINLRLSEPLTENCQVLVYCTYSAEIKMKGAQVITTVF